MSTSSLASWVFVALHTRLVWRRSGGNKEHREVVLRIFFFFFLAYMRCSLCFLARRGKKTLLKFITYLNLIFCRLSKTIWNVKGWDLASKNGSNATSIWCVVKNKETHHHQMLHFVTVCLSVRNQRNQHSGKRHWTDTLLVRISGLHCDDCEAAAEVLTAYYSIQWQSLDSVGLIVSTKVAKLWILFRLVIPLKSHREWVFLLYTTDEGKWRLSREHMRQILPSIDSKECFYQPHWGPITFDLCLVNKWSISWKWIFPLWTLAIMITLPATSLKMSSRCGMAEATAV